jgi:hypothetical protein
MNTTPRLTYKQVLLNLIQFENSKKFKEFVVQAIKKSFSRKTLEDDECPIWVFCEIINPQFQMQSKNCIFCGNYIQIGWGCKNVDPERKIKHIYCNYLKHQHATNRLVSSIWVKDLLKLYYVEKQNHFLYHAALECVLYLKPELHTFAYVFREYIGILHNVY